MFETIYVAIIFSCTRTLCVPSNNFKTVLHYSYATISFLGSAKEKFIFLSTEVHKELVYSLYDWAINSLPSAYWYRYKFNYHLCFSFCNSIYPNVKYASKNVCTGVVKTCFSIPLCMLTVESKLFRKT